MNLLALPYSKGLAYWNSQQCKGTNGRAHIVILLKSEKLVFRKCAQSLVDNMQ